MTEAMIEQMHDALWRFFGGAEYLLDRAGLGDKETLDLLRAALERTKNAEREYRSSKQEHEVKA